MAALLYVLPHPTRISLTLGLTILGGIVYFAVLAVIDWETRELIRSAISEVKSRLGRT